MRKIILILGFVLITIALVACDQMPQDDDDIVVANPHNDIYYVVFVRSFADSDNDGIGDLQGLAENMDYFTELGVTALWLLPINPSPSYHGYSVTDYFGIEEDYGDMTDFETMMDAADDAGIKIMMDLVINHTSDQHPWYVSAQNPTSAYRDYYIWDNGVAFESFGGGMKDLNLSNPDVVERIKSIMTFWLEKGVHGFRLDAAKHFFDKPGIAGVDVRNTLFINELNLHMDSVDPDSYLLAEVFDYSEAVYPNYYIGTDSLFNFYGAAQIWDKVGSGNNRYLLARNFERFYDALRVIDPDFTDAPFLTNHDLDRLASTGAFAGAEGPAKLRQATSFLLTLPGSPFIYYGEELGMKGYRDYANDGQNVPGYGVAYDEYRRTPFLWGDPSLQTTWFPDTQNFETPSLDVQRTDPDSLFSHYRTMIALRSDNPALMYGNSFIPYVENANTLQGYVRHYDDGQTKQAVLVIHNLSSDPVVLDIAHLDILYGSRTLEGYGTVVYEIDPDLIGDYS
jgi:alpha-amylase